MKTSLGLCDIADKRREAGILLVRSKRTMMGSCHNGTEKRAELTIFRIESRWKPNFWVRSRKMSSISSFDSGMWRSADHAGYASRPGVIPPYSLKTVGDEVCPVLWALRDSAEVA
jgi:hypothetical protein